MPDNIKLKQYNLKSFLYNFFIIWNLLIIILLLLLTYYFNSKKIIAPTVMKKQLKVSGQHKLVWQSKKEFQDIDTDIFYIDTARINNDTIYDYIAISRTGHLIAFEGKYGHIIFIVDTGIAASRFSIVNNKIITGNTNGKIIAFNKEGKKIWENQIMNLSRIKVSEKKPETNQKATNISAQTTKTKNQSIHSNIRSKILVPWVPGKIIDIHLDVIQTKYALYSINPTTGKVLKNFSAFPSPLHGLLAYEDFNNDSVDDYLVCQTNSIHCLDGRTLKEIWQRRIPGIISGNKSPILNNKNELFIILPCLNGIVKILNPHAVDIYEINLNEFLIHPPLVFKNKNFIFLQPTLQNNIYAFNFDKRKNIWSINIPETIRDLKNADLNYDSINEIIILTETGKIYIINSENGYILDSFKCLESGSIEKITSNLTISDIDNDNNFELSFATDKGNMYVYKYVLFNKGFLFKKLFKSIASLWNR